jgi:hypothetical protein
VTSGRLPLEYASFDAKNKFKEAVAQFAAWKIRENNIVVLKKI